MALSRVQSLDGLYLSAYNPSRIRTNIKVEEFYKSIPEKDYICSQEEELEEEEYDPNIKRIRF